MAMLHTVNKSPFERNSLETCLSLAKKGSSILMIEDGVIGAMQNTKYADQIAKAMDNFTFYVLAADVSARGLKEENIIAGIKPVDYNGFVDLASEHESVQSWL